MNVSEPYRDHTKPGRKDVNGVEWWACDPYPTWYRWEDGELYRNHAEWLPDDPLMAERKADQLDREADALAEKVKELRTQAALCRYASVQEETA